MPGVFISYRRSDVAGQAGRLAERLAEHFGEELVFLDVDSLTSGERFEVEIERAIAGADAVLALIGPRWDLKRLDEEDDFVRKELTTALRLQRRLIPVCVDGAPVPTAESLPAAIRDLVNREATEIRHSTFSRDVAQLIADLEREGLRPAASVGPRGLAIALARAGWPYSWFAPVVRRLKPGLAMLLLLFVVGATWTATARAVWRRGWSQGNEAGREVTTAQYEIEAEKQRQQSLILKGRVKDRANNDLTDAAVTVTNRANGRRYTTSTAQDGQFVADLRTIGITFDAIVQLEVVKPRFRSYRDEFLFGDGLEYRSYLDSLPPSP